MWGEDGGAMTIPSSPDDIATPPPLPPPLPVSAISMAHQPPQLIVGPVVETQRIVVLDVLRGFAILGILIINIQSFSMVEGAYLNPSLFGDFTGINYAVWLISHIAAEQKFISIFSMLFGAGVLLMADRMEAAGRRPGRFHYRRMLILLGIGLLHAYLLWYGDILVYYALIGMLVFLFRRLSPRPLVIIGICGYLAVGVMMLMTGLMIYVLARVLPPEAADQMLAALGTEQSIAEEVQAYRGGWLEQMSFRVPTAIMMHTWGMFFFGLGGAGGLMLIGMALYKLGVLTGQRSSQFYRRVAVWGTLLPIPVILLGVWLAQRSDWRMEAMGLFGKELNHVVAPIMSLGYIAAVILATRAAAFSRAVALLIPVGRMALTNYLLQTIICTTIFYGHGLGLFGRVQRIGQLGIVIAVWILLIIFSNVWMAHFRYGPFEWLWRWLTYGARPPLRRAANVETAPV
jgi:uncharacterized protein